MRNIRFLWNNLIDPNSVTLTYNSQEADYPASNVVHRWHTWCYRSTGVADEWLKWDLANAQDVNAFVIKNHNFQVGATVDLEGHTADGDWGNAEVKEHDIPVTSERIIHWISAIKNYRWWRLRVRDVGNGVGYLKIGRIFLGTYFSPEHNFTDKYRKKLVDPSSKRYSSGGQISSNQKTHFKEWSYFFGSIKSPDDDSFESIFDEVGQSKPYFICQDADDDHNTLYYVQNLSDWDLEHQFMDTWYKLDMDIEEMR